MATRDKELKDYGPHSYDPHGTSDCAHGCGCWAGGYQSGGSPGIDPLSACPNNPKDGKRQDGDADYRCVVEGRINDLKGRLYRAEEIVARLGPGAEKTSEKLARREQAVSSATSAVFQALRQLVGPDNEVRIVKKRKSRTAKRKS